MKRFTTLLCLSGLITPALYGMQQPEVKMRSATEVDAQSAQSLPQAILDSLHDKRIIQVALSKAGDVIAVATEYQVACYNAQGERLGQWDSHAKIVTVALSSDGEHLVVGMADGTFAKLVEKCGHSFTRNIYKGGRIRAVLFSESDKVFVVLVDFRDGQVLQVGRSSETGWAGEPWSTFIKHADFNQISANPDASRVLLYNGTACRLAQLEEWESVGEVAVDAYIGSHLEVKSALWLNATIVMLFVFDNSTKKYSTLTFDVQNKTMVTHALPDTVNWQGAFVTTIDKTCYLAKNYASTTFANKLVLYHPITGAEMSSYRSPLFGDDQFVISAGGGVIAYSNGVEAAPLTAGSESPIAHDDTKYSPDKPSKKTVQQKITKAYHDVANLWRTDKKRFALYAAGACVVIAAGIGAIKYAKKKKLGTKISGIVRTLRGNKRK